ncbi:MAG: hypothetical protein ABIH23_12205 [bacterium]
MFESSALVRLTDKNASDLIGNAEAPYIILFESRYDSHIAKMIEAFRATLESLGPGVLAFVCMVEDAPELSQRFEVFGVPTTVLGLWDSVLGVSLGMKTADQLRSLVENWLQRGTARPVTSRGLSTVSR